MADLTGTGNGETLEGGVGSDTLNAGGGNDVIYGDQLVANGNFEGDAISSGWQAGIPSGWEHFGNPASLNIGTYNPAGVSADGIVAFINSAEVGHGLAQNTGVAYNSAHSYNLQVDVGDETTNPIFMQARIYIQADNGSLTYVSAQGVTVPANTSLYTGVNLTIPAGATAATGNVYIALVVESGVNSQLLVDNVRLTTSDPAYNSGGGVTDTAGLGDVIDAGAGNDIVHGGAGNDTIDGGSGNDSLLGGDGNDTFRLEDAGNDTVDGGDGYDVLDLSGVTITGANANFSNIEEIRGSDYIGGDSWSWTTDSINFIGGLGGDSISAGTGSDTLSGNGGDDTLSGGGGNDSLSGGIGADSLLGGGGDDTLLGGTGDDQLEGGDGADSMDGGDGIDTATYENSSSGVIANLATGGTGNDAIGDIYTNIENLTGTAFTDDLTGDANANVISGGAGYNIVDGGAGNDTLYTGDDGSNLAGGDGDDLVYGGANTDSIDIQGGADTVFAGAGLDYIRVYDGFGNHVVDGGVAAGTGFSGDQLSFLYYTGNIDIIITGTGAGTATDGVSTITYSDIEMIRLGVGDDTLDASGSSADVFVWDPSGGDNLITGGSGNLTYFDTIGNATVFGGTGDDSLTLSDGDDQVALADGFGNDTIIGGEAGEAAGDTLDASALTSGVNVVFTTTDGDDGTLSDGVDTVGFTEIENLTYTEFNDTVDASGVTSAMSVSGAGGNDIITGGTGDDTLAGGDGDDLIDGGDGNDFLTTGEGQDTLIGGLGNDTLMNSDGDDSLDGGAGDDSIIATGGEDTLRGGTGDDTMDGGDDADTFIIEDGFGNDSITGGEGTTDPGDVDFDTIDLSALSGAVTVTYTGDEAGTITDGTDTIAFTEIENLILTDQSDSVQGGADGAGLTIDARGGDDTIEGGSGNDTIDGGAGDDSIEGGAGDDTFTYQPGDGSDTITDFNTGNTGTLDDGDSTNNDFINLSSYYDHISELYADQADDGVLNQSNTTDSRGNATDYSNNTSFGAGSMTFSGASADESSFTAENTGVVCFTSGTAIRTPLGDVLIDDLRVGDLVSTMDNGPQRIAWIGQRHVTHAELLQNDRLHPVLIKKGVLGATRNLLVSRQHGMLLGQDHLGRAIHLAKTMPGIRVAKGKRQVTYVHLMFEKHQIIFAEGIPSESFYPGPMAMEMLSSASREQLRLIFPRLGPAVHHGDIIATYGDTARVFLENRKAVETWLLDTENSSAKEIKMWDVDLAIDRYEIERSLKAKSRSQAHHGMRRAS
ncbi:Hint domain-containing protein [Sulfitobacter sp. F26204]|uniref:Hint domain-containing protein n=1 Tax=Sulfitobacter sp. F26204 TaxID=2996014 RepID=UPI00225DDD39|nr:Hint domain-containing protein [Sulfitobacter sp. F26204]MCX7561466.1 Hint domain-containing protein [Sulfitobacter sp. F26204]